MTPSKRAQVLTLLDGAAWAHAGAKIKKLAWADGAALRALIWPDAPEDDDFFDARTLGAVSRLPALEEFDLVLDGPHRSLKTSSRNS